MPDAKLDQKKTPRTRRPATAATITPATTKPKRSRKPDPEKVYDVFTVIPERSKYKPEYCEQLIAHRQKGYSMKSFAAVVGVHRDTLYVWREQFPRFREACDKSRDECLYFYERLGMDGITGRTNPQGVKKFNPLTFIYMTKNLLRDDFKNDPPEELPPPKIDNRPLSQITKDPNEASAIYQKIITGGK